MIIPLPTGPVISRRQALGLMTANDGCMAHSEGGQLISAEILL